jgi:hypothetical protein
MKRMVTWKSKHSREEWDGEVEICVKQGDNINLVFSCTELGEGQITLTDTDDVQVVTSRFLYYGRQEATQVSVRGRFLRHSEAVVFEGVWTDPMDGTGEWAFMIDLDGDEVPELRRASPADDEEMTFEPSQLDALPAPDPVTDWFPIDIEPVRRGLYQVRYDGQAEAFSYASWDGAEWCIEKPTSGAGSGIRPRVNRANMTSWRGLTEEGARMLTGW